MATKKRQGSFHQGSCLPLSHQAVSFLQESYHQEFFHPYHQVSSLQEFFHHYHQVSFLQEFFHQESFLQGLSHQAVSFLQESFPQESFLQEFFPQVSSRQFFHPRPNRQAPEHLALQAPKHLPQPQRHAHLMPSNWEHVLMF